MCVLKRREALQELEAPKGPGYLRSKLLRVGTVQQRCAGVRYDVNRHEQRHRHIIITGEVIDPVLLHTVVEHEIPYGASCRMRSAMARYPVSQCLPPPGLAAAT